MNKQELKNKILSMLIEMNNCSISKEEYNKYMEEYNKKDKLLKTGPEYYYIPKEDIVIESDTVYNVIEKILDEVIKDMKEDLLNE